MRLLVTGSAGMLGQAVVAAADRLGHEVTALARAELDITDPDQVAAQLGRAQPRALINCAAYTDVDGAESDPRAAHAVNADGAANLARASANAAVHLLHVSTDYVFDGQSPGRPYLESDPTAPLSAYGQSKLAGERQVRAASPANAIVRTSWLFGAGGRNFADTMLRLAEQGRDEVAVVTDQVGCPTWTGHLAPALIELAERADAGVRHVVGAGSCTWNEFAVEIFAQAAIDCRVLPTTTAATARPAPRPAFSVLASERDDPLALPPWQAGLAGYLEQRRAATGAAAATSRDATSDSAPPTARGAA